MEESNDGTQQGSTATNNQQIPHANVSTTMTTVTDTISALLSYSSTAQKDSFSQTILPQFASPLKTNFEDRNLWLRFGLTLALSRQSPQSALQAFTECLRIDHFDPLPAMLAAKLLLLELDAPEEALQMAEEAIKRCQRLEENEKGKKINGEGDIGEVVELDNHWIGNHYLEAKCCYKNIAPLLSKSYILTSIIHAYIYERIPESIKQFKTSNLKASLHYLDLASKSYSENYLAFFHKALHEAKQRSYSTAIDNLRQAIKLNPHHVPSFQLLILSLSALKLHNEALVLCESTLQEFEDNLLLLYIKCNLEQCLPDTRGCKSALATARHILRCIRKSTSTVASSSSPTSNTDEQNNQPAVETKQTTNLFIEDKGDSTKQDLFASELFVWLLVAEIFIKIGSLADAELCIDEGSTHINGALSHHIMFARGLVAKAKNNLIEAKSFFQSCLALHPRYPKALQQIAHVHFQLGNHTTAEKFLKDSLDLDSECHKSWYYLSLVYIETNQHDKANECVKKANLLEECSPVISISAISRLTLE